MWHFIGQKKENFGLSKRLTVAHGELRPGYSAVVIGDLPQTLRQGETSRKMHGLHGLLGRVCRSFAKGTSYRRQGAHDIEHDNSNTRHHLGRFTRRTKVVSQKQEMVDLTLRIWHAVNTADLFASLQNTALSIFG
jgi:hypothetical protein